MFMQLYPIKFSPIAKDRLWGGNKLQTVLEKPFSGDTIGESWELSGVDGDVSVVENGALAGQSLTELMETFKERLLGQSVFDRFGMEFPILIKFIDAKQDLSIQLHPHDDLAKERHNSFGKTEMWYIMDSDPGAELIVGFNRDVTKEEYQEYLDQDRLLELLNYEEVKEGDTFFINTGKIHAIGAGVMLAEIQQTSDITYRVFDFNRRDKEGNLRELHTEMALDAMDYQKKDDFKVQYQQSENQANELVHCPYFKTDYHRLTESLEWNFESADSFRIYMCVGGEATLEAPEGSVHIKKGETALIPAELKSLKVKTESSSLLEVTI
jgi:mannose-6-phosphate isomerase